MKIKFGIAAILLASVISLGLAVPASGGSTSKDTNTSSATAAAAAAPSAQDETMRLEGEKRFHSNCGRCHAAPPKFPPRMMSTIVHHMRVRATITDQDMHLILRYMTE